MSESNKKNTTNRDTLVSSMNVTEASNKSYFEEGKEEIEREEIKGSPYWIIGNDDEGYFLGFGKWRLTELMKTKEDVLEHLRTNKYNVILQTVMAVIEVMKLKDSETFNYEGQPAFNKI